MVFMLITAMCLGVISIYRIPVEFLPPMDLPFIICQIPYIGATPEQVEKGSSDSRRANSERFPASNAFSPRATPNGATIRMIFEMGTNATTATADVRDRMERLKLVLPTKSRISF